MDNYFDNKIINEKMLKERIIFLDKEINAKTASEIVTKLLYLDDTFEYLEYTLKLMCVCVVCVC